MPGQSSHPPAGLRPCTSSRKRCGEQCARLDRIATAAAALCLFQWDASHDRLLWHACWDACTQLQLPLATTAQGMAMHLSSRLCHVQRCNTATRHSQTCTCCHSADTRCRYMYQETFGRWHAIDLFFGLAYLSRRSIDEYPAADIAAAGHALHDEHMQSPAAQDLIQQLQEVKRYMLYCQGLKHQKPELQLKHWRITTGLGERHVLRHVC